MGGARLTQSRLLAVPTPARVRRFVRWLPMRIGYVHGPRLMSWLRKRWVLLRHPHANIIFGKGVYLCPRLSLFIPHEVSFIVGDRFEFRRDSRPEACVT